jgi:hypothetical protein
MITVVALKEVNTGESFSPPALRFPKAISPALRMLGFDTNSPRRLFQLFDWLSDRNTEAPHKGED